MTKAPVKHPRTWDLCRDCAKWATDCKCHLKAVEVMK